MKTYIQKRGKYYAVSYTGNNRDEIIRELQIKRENCSRWVNQDTQESYLIIDAPGCNLGKVLPNQWIVVGAEKENVGYFVYSKEKFEQEYQEIRQ